MHPLNKRNFGPEVGRIAVKFFDGSAVVTGWILKQPGATTFVVTDGTTTKTCKLAKTADELTALEDGTGPDADKQDDLCTMEISFEGDVNNVAKISSNIANTVQGNSLKWILGDSDENGSGELASVVE